MKDVTASLELGEWPDRRVDQSACVRGSDVSPARVPAPEVREARAQNGSLKLVEAAIDARAFVAVAGGLPVLTKPSKALREHFVVGYHRAAVAERGEVLRRVKAEATQLADRARASPAKLRAGSLRAVFDDVDLALGAECDDRVGIGAL